MGFFLKKRDHQSADQVSAKTLTFRFFNGLFFSPMSSQIEDFRIVGGRVGGRGVVADAAACGGAR
jgi:hypothetical protein